MPALTRPTKITFAEMRTAGVRGVLIYCSDSKCSYSTAISADQWPDHVRLSDRGDGLPLVSWGARFDDPIALANGRKLLTLQDAPPT